MENILEKVKEVITKPMADIDIVVGNIEYVKENNYNFLKITLDKPGGLDLDTIVQATEIINPIMDEYDLIEEEYILDISSKERG